MRPTFTCVLAIASTGVPADYFVDSETGSDESAGTSQASAIRSLDRLARLTLQPGDRVLLKRGCTFRGRLRLRGNGTEGKPIRLTAFGEGPKPEVLGSVRLTEWDRQKGEVYKHRVSAKAFYGKKTIYSAYEYDEGRAPIRLVRDKAVPTERGHFFFDADVSLLYLKATDGAHPSTHRIEASVIEQLVYLTDQRWIEVDGLAFMFGNCRHIGLVNCQDVTIRNCASLFVGYYGNPNILIHRGSTRCRLIDCFLYENVNCGVYLSSGAHHNLISGCTIVKCKSNDGVTIHSGGRDKYGVRQGLAGDHNVVENNVIGLCPEESIDITSGDYHAIRGNICYGNGNPGIIVGHDSDHILIQNNICFDNNRSGIQIGGQEKEGARGENRVIQNLVYENGYPGLEIQGKNTYVFNNTVVNSRERVAVRINARGQGSVFKNNLILTLDPTIRFASFQFIGGTPTTFDVKLAHNLFFHIAKPDGRVLQTNEGGFTPAQLLAKYGTGRGCTVAAPKLCNDRGLYYFLRPDSPGVDAGVDVGLTFSGKAPDVGWVEVGDEARVPKYPEVLVDSKDDEAAVLYLWGKSSSPPREARERSPNLLDASAALARGSECESSGKLSEAAVWYHVGAHVATDQDLAADARARLAAVLTKPATQSALRVSDACAAIGRARFFLGGRKKKVLPAMHYLQAARADAAGKPEVQAVVERMLRDLQPTTAKR